MYKIEKNIAIPSRRMYARGQSAKKYPFEEMKKGDSFMVKTTSKTKIATVRTYANKIGRKNNLKFVTRRVPGGLRVWKV